MNIKKLITPFLALLLLYSGYAGLTEYRYYRDSLPLPGRVSNVDVVTSEQRRMTDTCTHFRGREDCATLYHYDITWRVLNKDGIYSVTGQHKKPSTVECIDVFMPNPTVAKPCNQLFFNASHLPATIAIWAIVAFILLTLMLYRYKQRRFNPPCKPQRHRIYNHRHQLLLETNDRDEAFRFINSGYRLHSASKSVIEIAVGQERGEMECVNYSVRSRKGRRKMGP